MCTTDAVANHVLICWISFLWTWKTAFIPFSSLIAFIYSKLRCYLSSHTLVFHLNSTTLWLKHVFQKGNKRWGIHLSFLAVICWDGQSLSLVISSYKFVWALLLVTPVFRLPVTVLRSGLLCQNSQHVTELSMQELSFSLPQACSYFKNKVKC